MTYLPPTTTQASPLTGANLLQITQNGRSVSTTLATLATFLTAQPRGPSGTYDDWFINYGNRETHGVFSLTQTPIWTAESSNSNPALGAFQFNKEGLRIAGYYTNDGAMSALPWIDAKFTGLDGITSKAAFLASSATQIKAAHVLNASGRWPDLVSLGCPAYIGQTIAGILITSSGLLGGSVLLGSPAVQTFLTSGGATDGADAFGTHISEYIRGFGGFATPFSAS